jgi:hypothetical protein
MYFERLCSLYVGGRRTDRRVRATRKVRPLSPKERKETMQTQSVAATSRRHPAAARWAAASILALTVATGAQARRGADDPAGDFRRGRGSDDAVVLRRGADDTGPDERGRSRGRRGRSRAGSAQPISRSVVLQPTPAGIAARIWGTFRLEVRPDRNREKVKVEVQSRGLAAGTVLQVFVVNPSQSQDPILLANLTLAARIGSPGQTAAQVELESENGALPTGVSPVLGITAVFVVRPDTGEVLLTSG